MAGTPRSILALLVFCLSFVVNPGYFTGCTSSESAKPNFGEAEMLELLDEAKATGPFELEHDGERYRLEYTLEQKSGEDYDEFAWGRPSAFAARAHACGTRSFMAKAAACSTSSEIPLTGRVTLVRLDAGGETRLLDDAPLEGELRVGGLKLSNGWLTLRDGTTDSQLDLRSGDGRTFELAQFRTRLGGFPTSFVER